MAQIHQLTKRAEICSGFSKKRIVAMQRVDGPKRYEAISFDSGEDKYTIVGPTSSPRKQRLKVNLNDIIIMQGTPVICRGLTHDALLNGKIGDVISVLTGQYKINFEDQSLESAVVKPHNLRILFDLPVRE